MGRKKASKKGHTTKQLSNEDLDKVTGGIGSFTQPVSEEILPAPSGETNTIISPRDPASGLPTGKRRNKPIL